MVRHGIAAIGMIAGLTTGAAAQDAIYWRTPAAAAASAQTAYVPMGTPLMLVTRTQISTKTSKPGDRLYLDVAENLTVRGQIVVPAGSIAVAEVVRSDGNGYFGVKGKIDIRLDYVETPYGPIRLTGRANDEGTSGLAASIATIALVSPLGFLIRGTSAHLPFGTPVQAYLGEDLRFALAPPAVAAAEAPRALPASFDPRAFAAGPVTASR